MTWRPGVWDKEKPETRSAKSLREGEVRNAVRPMALAALEAAERGSFNMAVWLRRDLGRASV